MLSLKHHALYWVVSFLTLPLTALRKCLTNRGLLPDIINDLEYPLVGLLFYFLSRWAMKLLQEAKQRTEQEVKFSGLVTPIQAEEPEKEPIAETKVNSNSKTNGNSKINGNSNGKGKGKNAKKRFARGQKKASGQNRNNSNQNGNTKSNRNRTPNPPVQLNLNKISRKRLQKTPTSRDESIKRAVSYFVEHCLEELYFVSLILLFTRAKLPGFEESPGGGYDQQVARVLITFMTLGTLEPLRCSRWDIEACGLGMFSYCCVFCGDGPGPWKSAVMGAISLCMMGALIEALLWIKTGQYVCWPALWLASDNLSAFDMLVRISALAPLIDIIETVSLKGTLEDERLIFKY